MRQDGPGARCRLPPRARGVLLPAVEVRVELPLCLILRVSVALLEEARQLIEPSRCLVELVVGQLAPLLLDATLQLLPLPGEDVAIHLISFFSLVRKRERANVTR